MPPPTKSSSRNLAEDCVREALAIVEEVGVENLSLRDVARRLGVSHQAPYKHFPSRDHIVAEMVSRAFASFAAYLDAREKTDIPHQDMAAMGRAYLGYALAHPLNYRLMFATQLPDPAKHPEMMREGQHAFSMLRDVLGRIHRSAGRDVPRETLALDALYVWSTMHGLASILESDAINSLGLAPETLAAAPEYVQRHIGAAFGIDPDAEGRSLGDHPD